MRTAITCLLLSTLTNVLAPIAAHAAATGEVESVVVFADRARVTRARTVACEKGTARAVFERLPQRWTCGRCAARCGRPRR